MLIDRVGAEQENVGSTAALRQSDWIIRRQRGLLCIIISLEVTYCCKRRVEWRLTIRVLDFVAIGRMGIVDIEVETTDGKAEVCIGVKD